MVVHAIRPLGYCVCVWNSQRLGVVDQFDELIAQGPTVWCGSDPRSSLVHHIYRVGLTSVFIY